MEKKKGRAEILKLSHSTIRRFMDVNGPIYPSMVNSLCRWIAFDLGYDDHAMTAKENRKLRRLLEVMPGLHYSPFETAITIVGVADEIPEGQS